MAIPNRDHTRTNKVKAVFKTNSLRMTKQKRAKIRGGLILGKMAISAAPSNVSSTMQKGRSPGLLIFRHHDAVRQCESRVSSLERESCLAEGCIMPVLSCRRPQAGAPIRRRRISVIRLPRSKLATLFTGGKLRLRRRSFRLQGSVAVDDSTKCRIYVYKQVKQ